jgi:hypothetical protein
VRFFSLRFSFVIQLPQFCLLRDKLSFFYSVLLRRCLFRKMASIGMSFDPASYDASRAPTAPPPPCAKCKCAVKRVDITPPVGIHNRNWGAAAGDVSTGTHQPLYVTAMALAPTDDAVSGEQSLPMLVRPAACCFLVPPHTKPSAIPVSGTLTPSLSLSLSPPPPFSPARHQVGDD